MKPITHLLRQTLSLTTALLFTLASAHAESVDAGRNGAFPAAVTDDISFSSPTQGTTYQQIPPFNGRVRDYGMDTLSSVIEQLDAAGRPVGYVKWSTGEILEHTNSNFLFGGVAYVKSWNSLSTGSFTLPQVTLPAGNYRLNTVGTLMVYGYPFTVGTAKVSFRVEPPYAWSQTQSGDTITIAQPTDGQLFNPGSEVRVSGNAGGDNVESVRIGLLRYDDAGQVSEILNWDSLAWEPFAGDLPYRNATPATGVTQWSATIPASVLANGRYGVFALGLSDHTIFPYVSGHFAISDPEPEPITFASPANGATLTSTPVFRGTLTPTGIEVVHGYLVRIDASGEIVAMINWQTGVALPVEQYTAETPGFYGELAWTGQPGTFEMVGPVLADGDYGFLAFGGKSGKVVAQGSVVFRIETPVTDPHTDSDGGPVLPPGLPGTDGDVTTPGDDDVTLPGTGDDEEEEHIPSAPVAGTYDGPVLAQDDPESCLGHLSLAVNANGRCTARFVFNGVTGRAKGQLIDGEAVALALPSHAVLPAALRATARYSRGIVEVKFTFDGAVFTSRLELGRYNARTNPALLTGRCEMNATAVESITDTVFPTGAAKAKLKVSKSGRFTCVGRLADGRRFSAAGVVHEDEAGGDHFSFAVRPAKTQDSLVVPSGQITGSADQLLEATMKATWDRYENLRARQYAEGFCLDLSFESVR